MSAKSTQAERIAYAERIGYKRCTPYEIIGSKSPRWYFNGGYYTVGQLPSPKKVRLLTYDDISCLRNTSNLEAHLYVEMHPKQALKWKTMLISANEMNRRLTDGRIKHGEHFEYLLGDVLLSQLGLIDEERVRRNPIYQK